MFELSIGSVRTLFSKFFSVADRTSVIEAVRASGARRAVFLDTPATTELVETIHQLVEVGVSVVVRDHHDVEGSPRNPREEAIRSSVERIREMLGENARISTRSADPACSSLLRAGEFAIEGTALVADNDLDGLTAAMKAAGIVYAGLDEDAAVLDGSRAEQTAERLTPFALLLVRGLSTLPPYDAARPQVAEEAKRKLFADFVAMVGGDAEAHARLEKAVEAYEQGVREAEAALANATEVATGVQLVDICGRPRVDLGTLTRGLESRSGCRITVVRKDNGPIAAKHGGVQVSMAVVKAEQAKINLQELLPTGFVSSPDTGIISNTTFLLHVSENVWNETVLPALKVRLG